MKDESSRVAKSVRKAMQEFEESDQQYAWYGWELFHILEGRAKRRFEIMVTGYSKAKEDMK